MQALDPQKVQRHHWSTSGQPWGSSGNSCLSSTPGTSHPIYAARCARPSSARLCSMHGSNTWGATDSDKHRLHRNDRSTIHLILSTKDRHKTSLASLFHKLAVGDIIAVLRSRRLRWSGHVHRVTSSIKTASDFTMPSNRKWRRTRKAWSECVKNDIRECDLSDIDHKTETHGGPVFYMACCCQLLGKRHEQHPDIKMFMDGWWISRGEMIFHYLS